MRNNSFFLRSFMVGMILTCFTIIPIPGQKAKIEKKDGLTIIYNPKKPVKKAGSPSTLVLNPDIRIGDRIEDENYSFSRIGGVEVDMDEDIIVIDEGGIYILSFFFPEKELFYCIRNNKAYSFINENEEGIPMVKRYNMDWQ